MDPDERPRSAAFTYIADCALIVFVVAILVLPLFTMSYTTNWASIESTFIADARFLLEHWNHPRWQPLWYGGTRWDYIYPPALRYGTAITSALLHSETVVGYHFYTTLLYCLGIAGVYVLTRVGTGSRGYALLAAALVTIISPAYLFLPEIRHGASWHEPQRLRVLVQWGEGPHISALSLLGFALAACYRALERFRPGTLAAGAILCAAVVAHNFYGATALAMFFPVLVWSVWITRPARGVLIRAVIISVLSYGLTAYWLVPSYLRVTSDNLKLVAAPGNSWSKIAGIAILAVFAAVSAKAGWRRAARTWPIFVAGSLLVFSVTVLGNAWFGFRITGEPIRFVPELDLVMIIGAVLVIQYAAKWPFSQRWKNVAAIIFAVLVLAGSARYLRHAWHLATPDPGYQDRVEYKIQQWVARNAPASRNFVMGGIRFWYDVWADLPQFGGGSEQGMLNQAMVPGIWEIRLAPDPRASILWLQAFGTGLVTMSDPESEDPYQDYPFFKKFDGVLPVVYDNTKGNRIYQVPRRFPELARVVRSSAIEAAEPPRHNGDRERLQVYVDAVEQGPDIRPRMEWHGLEDIRVHARYSPGDSLLLQIAYDPNWIAEGQGKRLQIWRDALGQMVVRTPPGEYEVRFSFPLPRENRAGILITAISVAACIVLAGLGVKREIPRASWPRSQHN